MNICINTPQSYWYFCEVYYSNTCARYKYNTSAIRLITVKSFYQVEELGEGVSEDGAWGSLYSQVTRAEGRESWNLHL